MKRTSKAETNTPKSGSPTTQDSLETTDVPNPDKIVQVPIATLKPHSLYAKMMPPLNKYRAESLVEDVNKNGVLIPLLVQHPNIILCGEQYWQAAKTAGLSKIPIVVVQLTSEGQDNRVVSDVLLRPSLTEDQRAAVAYLWQRKQSKRSKAKRARQAARGRWSRPKGCSLAQTTNKHEATEPEVESQPSNTRVLTAKRFGVSVRRLREVKTLYNKKFRNLFEQVRLGKMSLKAAQALRDADGESKERQATSSSQGNGVAHPDTKPGRAKRQKPSENPAGSGEKEPPPSRTG